jgi:hypothetical protein
MVTGADGKEYGPTDVSTLKLWVSENRLAPHTMLRDFSTGQQMTAGSLPELFPSSAVPSAPGAPPVTAAYPRAGYAAPASRDHGGGVLVNVIIRSVLGLVSFFLIGGFGFIFAGYALYYAIRCQQSGSKYGVAAIAIAGTSLAIILAGWAILLSTGRA